MSPGTADEVRALRQALGRFATGVTLITCADAQGQPVGLTANSFNSLSLDPPLVLWSLRLQSPTEAAFRQSGHFAVNVLGASQIELSRRFASDEPDKFALGDWSEGSGRAPVLGGCAAVLECATVSHQVLGDHVLFIGQVLRHREAPVAPLLFQGGEYRALGPAL